MSRSGAKQEITSQVQYRVRKRKHHTVFQLCIEARYSYINIRYTIIVALHGKMEPRQMSTSKTFVLNNKIGFHSKLHFFNVRRHFNSCVMLKQLLFFDFFYRKNQQILLHFQTIFLSPKVVRALQSDFCCQKKKKKTLTCLNTKLQISTMV